MWFEAALRLSHSIGFPLTQHKLLIDKPASLGEHTGIDAKVDISMSLSLRNKIYLTVLNNPIPKLIPKWNTPEIRLFCCCSVDTDYQHKVEDNDNEGAWVANTWIANTANICSFCDLH